MTTIVVCEEHKLSELRNVLERCSLSAPLLGFYSLNQFYYREKKSLYAPEHFACLPQ